jgi:hypothetical protein
MSKIYKLVKITLLKIHIVHKNINTKRVKRMKNNLKTISKLLFSNKINFWIDIEKAQDFNLILEIKIQNNLI